MCILTLTSYVVGESKGNVEKRKDRRADLSIYALAAVDQESVRLQAGHVHGRWSSTEWRRFDEREIRDALRVFVSSPLDNGSIVNFTRLYGPLFAVFDQGKPFHEFKPVAEWKRLQRVFLRIWHFSIQADTTKLPLSSPIEGPAFLLVHDGVTGVGFGQWSDALRAVLLAIPRDDLRECQLSGCGKPFIADHRAARYCSTKCSNEQQRQWNENWSGSEKGLAWLAKRRKARSIKRVTSRNATKGKKR